MDISIVNLILTAILALAGVVIAIVGLVISYRQHRGYRPILIPYSWQMHSNPSKLPDHYVAGLKFEIWNRRRYPIHIRRVTLVFDEMEFESMVKGFDYSKNWNVQGRRFYYLSAHTVGPGSHHAFFAEAPFKKRTLDDLGVDVSISLTFFDPMRNKNIELNVVQRWGQSKEKIEERKGSERKGSGLEL